MSVLSMGNPIFFGPAEKQDNVDRDTEAFSDDGVSGGLLCETAALLKNLPECA